MGSGGKVSYKNRWVPDKEITEEKVELLAACGVCTMEDRE